MNLSTKKIVRSYILFKFLLFLLSAAFLFSFSFPVSASFVGGGDANVIIKVDTKYSKNYRYSADVIYYSMIFTFNLRSIAINTETGETSVNTGEWMMDENRTDSVTITVVNHSDTPIRATALVNEKDFSLCNMKVEKIWTDGNVIPPCEYDGEKIIIGEKILLLILDGYPTPETYEGEKRLFVTVEITPTSGYTTGGEYYEY